MAGLEGFKNGIWGWMRIVKDCYMFRESKDGRTREWNDGLGLAWKAEHTEKKDVSGIGLEGWVK